MRTLFQTGALPYKLPSHLTRRTQPTSRPQWHRMRQQRNNSTEPPTSNPSPKDTNKEPPKPSQPESQSTPPPPGSVASSAGASTPPVTGPAASRSLTQIIRTGPVGRVGRSYARMQDKRPYWTQLYSSIVVYLLADLSAQFLFPSEPVKTEDEEEVQGKEEDDEDAGAVQGGSYDPMRTLRHLTVGVVSSIPSYKWYVVQLHRILQPAPY